MKKKIRVVITGEDFVSSYYGSNTDCALAKALKRELPDANIRVGGTYVKVNSDVYDIPYRHINTIIVRCMENIDKNLVVILTKDTFIKYYRIE